MGKDLFREFSTARQVYERANECLGFDVARLSFEDPEDRLDQTQFAQPALLVHSAACLAVLEELTDGAIAPSALAGHSLGEYSALVAAETLTLEDAIRLVKARGELMGKYGRGKMLALKADLELGRELATRFFCGIGGCNLPHQTVVGGPEERIEELRLYAQRAHQLRGVQLNTEGAFHTYEMIEAAKRLIPFLQETAFAPPRTPVISNYSGAYHDEDAAMIRGHLFCQVFNPVKWIWSMHTAFVDGKRVIVELGGGVGGSGPDPATKIPNLSGITQKALRTSDHTGIYRAGINCHSLKATARFLRGLAKVTDEVADDPPHPSGFGVCGNAVDENWFHLVLPTRDGAISEAGVRLMEEVEDAGIGNVVQLITQTEDEVALDIAAFDPAASTSPQPYLEIVVGCETATVLHHVGEQAVRDELAALKRRLGHSGYRQPLPPPSNA
jgi:malonyl CoA-acyl carrier protein transacylase